MTKMENQTDTFFLDLQTKVFYLRNDVFQKFKTFSVEYFRQRSKETKLSLSR